MTGILNREDDAETVSVIVVIPPFILFTKHHTIVVQFPLCITGLDQAAEPA